MCTPQGIKCSQRRQEKDRDDKSGSLADVLMAVFPQTSHPCAQVWKVKDWGAAATFQPVYFKVIC